MIFIVLALLVLSLTANAQVAPLPSEVRLVPAIKRVAIVDNKYYTIKKNEHNKFVFMRVTEEGKDNIVKPQIITIVPAR